ncbi:protein adenylyltransferase SelO [Enterovibrio norvegicus]|uniref:Protein nucleotidyltransferase YdiU n=1 Tax=Enterovibrio norvegicus DSM 15893 TaxID=1121869 RepID=A0A1I5QJV1_9GAMM|nr:YdiU family protein [Enterovibrio norvegicus]SFP46594.1 Uncharacterized conserved protein YdiU, UPF0061 family [Enterovibrio norvegicus DSM 15893]
MTNRTHSPHSNPIAMQRYTSLPDDMYVALAPTRSESPTMLTVNTGLIEEYGLSVEWFESADALGLLSGNHDYDGASPIAMAYSGHQFGHFSPLLGDGRAHMLGQLETADGKWVDVQLKGSGRTPFSRGGDGRATLGAVIREYLISEAMAGLGIPTTRTLALVTTGESIMRDYQMVPGAIQVRTAESHLRVGSFQYAYSKLGKDGVKALADFAIEQHFPEIKGRDDKYPAFLEAVSLRQADLISQWMLVGFIHGVMNTDNAAIVGESIDFGPCAFMDDFKANKVFSSIDRDSRYAWKQQASIGYWNLQRLAETLLPLFDDDTDNAVKTAETQIGAFIPRFQLAFQEGLKRKLGIASDSDAADAFVDNVMPVLEDEHIDFTLFFDALTSVAEGGSEDILLRYFDNAEKGKDWLKKWRQFSDRDQATLTAMRNANPALIARNHQVEKAIDDATERNDFTLFHRLSNALKTPYVVSDKNVDLQEAPLPEQCVLRTFCGT